MYLGAANISRQSYARQQGEVRRAGAAHLAIEGRQQDGGHLPLVIVLVQGARHSALHKQMPVLWLVQLLQARQRWEPGTLIRRTMRGHKAPPHLTPTCPWLRQ